MQALSLKNFNSKRVEIFSYLLTIMAQDRISMPSGMGGLVRYFDEYKSKVKFKPGHIVVLSVVVIIIMLFLYSYGNRLLGI